MDVFFVPASVDKTFVGPFLEVACKWDQAELVAVDGEVLIPGDPEPLVNTDFWVKEAGELFHTGREVSEEACVLE